MFFDELKENYTKVLVQPESSNIEPFPKKSSFTKTVCVLGLAGLCYFTIGNMEVFANDLDAKAEELYNGKFLTLAKWVIIGKGGWDTLNKVIKEDFDGAKKSFIQYLVVYATLAALPFALNQVDEIMKG